MIRKEKRIKEIICIVFILFLFFSGCTVKRYYSLRVLKNNELHIGIGKSLNYFHTSEMMRRYAWLDLDCNIRAGLKNGFDWGFNINTNYFPIGIGSSIRKQFDFKGYFIDAVNFELGGSLAIFRYEIFTGINLLHKNWAFSIGSKILKGAIPYLPDNGPYIGLLEYSITISYEYSLDRIVFTKANYKDDNTVRMKQYSYRNMTLLPFIRVFGEKIVEDYHNSLYKPLAGFNREYFDLNRFGIGAGISILWRQNI